MIISGRSPKFHGNNLQTNVIARQLAVPIPDDTSNCMGDNNGNKSDSITTLINFDFLCE